MPTSRALLAAVLFVCMALPAIATAASAGPPRVIVLQPEDELLRALSLALSPWGVETARSDAPPPRASQPEAVEGASLLARSSGAAAVIWVSSTTHGSLVWVFDARTGEIATRMLEQRRPLDGPAAAAVALSVKTVLRSSVIAPPAERFGAQPSSLDEAPTSRAELNGVVELGQKVAQSSDVRNCYAGRYMTYAYGRAITADDACSRATVESSFEQTSGNIEELVLAVTQTDGFLLRPLAAAQ